MTTAKASQELIGRDAAVIVLIEVGEQPVHSLGMFGKHAGKGRNGGELLGRNRTIPIGVGLGETLVALFLDFRTESGTGRLSLGLGDLSVPVGIPLGSRLLMALLAGGDHGLALFFGEFAVAVEVIDLEGLGKDSVPENTIGGRTKSGQSGEGKSTKDSHFQFHRWMKDFQVG